MAENLELFKQFTVYVQENSDIAQFGVYSVVFASLATATRLVRPFVRFSRPLQIPTRFIKARTKLLGKVERIEPNRGLLMVKHQPLIHLLWTQKPCLPIKISGVNVTGNGINWLQTIVSGNKVTFVPVRKQEDYLQCEVTMQQISFDNKKTTLHIGPTLVSVGFAKVEPLEKDLTKDPFHVAYYETLKRAEVMAEKRRLGLLKYYTKSVQNASSNLVRSSLSFIINKFKSKSPSTKTVNKSIVPA